MYFYVPVFQVCLLTAMLGATQRTGANSLVNCNTAVAACKWCSYADMILNVSVSLQELNLYSASTFRDLSRPMGAQTPERLKQFEKRYTDWDDPTGR